ncbi:hypothetical protein thsps21_34330 [Pseudomonas sp. No.21]|uniref:hypothetical protein n=1 Tax=Pseudomonas TaxID=286 RepID=UPI0003964AA4|nr:MULTISPECIES: hypothetical protein [Pseudomonas]EQM68303.1 hypothetical protein L682_18385 [Pseudomonas alcaligenes OT 69]MBB4816672.1 hypothetical protein [Pseudomonas alcaligenes]MDN4147531.1 hypothetical protein [Pseudomonas tohonis]MDW3714701.1 hypothetical protein [Pseudomonas sp. 2023EL-01195]PZE09350.1 hypothetical protein DMX10_31530 [Pseudomonas sp. 57B-090624]
MNRTTAHQLLLLLRRIRYSDPDRAFAQFMRFTGYVDALQDTGAYEAETLRRLDQLGLNAFAQRRGRNLVGE